MEIIKEKAIGVAQMTKEQTVLLILWLASILTILFFVPKTKYREAILAFLSCQSLTWINALLHVNYHLLIFPVREFPRATDLMFTSEFFIYPLIFAFHYISVPQKCRTTRRVLHLFLWISGLTLLDVLIERYTDLLEYIHYAWYWTWLNFFVIFTLAGFYCDWFIKRLKRQGAVV